MHTKSEKCFSTYDKNSDGKTKETEKILGNVLSGCP